jgi:hypothetical protein
MLRARPIPERLAAPRRAAAQLIQQEQNFRDTHSASIPSVGATNRQTVGIGCTTDESPS